MNHPAPEVHEALAEVLAAHENVECGHFAHGVKNWWSQCSGCDWSSPKHDERPTDRAADHRAHLASVLAAHFAEAVTEARARELREAADAIRDVRENGLPAGVTSHPYSELFERWLLARADSLAPETSGAEGDGIECPTSAITAASHDSAPELALARVIEVVEMYESCGPKQQSTRDVLAAVRTAALAPEAPSEAQA